MKNVPTLGTLIKGVERVGETIRTLAPYGFECFSIMFWERIGDVDLGCLCEEVREACDQTHTFISTLSLYGNPLREDEVGEEARAGFQKLIAHAPEFGVSVVSGFAGRVPGSSVPQSIEKWRVVFEPLVEQAEGSGVRIAFENCRLGDTWKTGKWNIAINPDAWEMMFEAIQSQSVGLEWEPCHQLEALADPLLQVAEWGSRFFHVHGKDARIDRTLLARKGLYGATKWYTSCFPGNGDTDWTVLLQALVDAGYSGVVDVEGWNDAEWSGDRELEGQMRALRYLQDCRRRLSITSL